MRRGRKLEHQLTGIDEHERTATCAKCGPVIVLEGKGRRRRQDSPWTCARRPPGRVGGTPTKHQLSDVDAAKKTGVCCICGLVRLVWRPYARGGGTWGCERTRFSIASFTSYRDDPNFVPAICPFCRRWHRWDRGQGKICRQKLVERDGANCAICRTPFSSENKPHVDHDHESGRVRGLLCGPCNVALGLLKDSAALLQRALQYLNQRRPWKS